MSEEKIDDQTQEHEVDPHLHFRGIVFKNGEVIVAGIPEDDLEWWLHDFIEIYSPIKIAEIVEYTQDGRREVSNRASKWQPMSVDTFFEISADTIQTVYLLKPKFETVYLNIVEQMWKQDMEEMKNDPNLTDQEREEIDDALEDDGVDESQLYVAGDPPKYLH